jgi:hypothetical protein
VQLRDGFHVFCLKKALVRAGWGFRSHSAHIIKPYEWYFKILVVEMSRLFYAVALSRGAGPQGLTGFYD